MSDKDKKKLTGFLHPLMKKMQCDTSLIQAAPVAYIKHGSERGLFDQTAIDGVEAAYQQYHNKLQREVQETLPRQAQLNQARGQHEARVAQCSQAADQAKATLSQFNTEQSALESQLKETGKKLKDIEKELKKAAEDVKSATEELAEVHAAITCIQELSDRVGDSLSQEHVVEDVE